MNIGIDARLLDGPMTGISRYLRNLIRYIPQFDNRNNYFLYTYNQVENQNGFYNIIQFQKKKLPKQIYSHYWLNFILPEYLDKNKIDIFFTPYILVPYKKGNYKNVIVIHDSMPKACKQYYTWHYRKYLQMIIPPSIKRSDAILTVSESARQDIIKFNDADPDKTHFMYLWTDEKYKPIELNGYRRDSLIKKYNLPDDFILYVGAIEERKNIAGILKISDHLKLRGIDIKFVFIGNPGFGYDQLELEINKRNDSIMYLRYVEEEELPLVYNLSKIFLFPSHYEGFGLPPLEAMKCGIPVLSSSNSSLIEVVGEGGLLGDENNIEFFVEIIIKLLNDKDFYSLMSKKAIEQAKNFTPDKQIPKLINLFNKLHN